MSSASDRRLVYSWAWGPRLFVVGLLAPALGIATVLLMRGAVLGLGSGPLLEQGGWAAVGVGVPLLSLLVLRRAWLLHQVRIASDSLVLVGVLTCRRISLADLQGAAWEERSYYSARQTQTFRARALRLDLRQGKPLRVLAGLYAGREEFAELLLELAQRPSDGRQRLEELLARSGRRGRMAPWPAWIPGLLLFVVGTAAAALPSLLDAECTMATVEHGRAAWESGSPVIARNELSKLDQCGSDAAVAAANDLQAALAAGAGDCPAARERLRSARERAARPDRAGLWAAAWCDRAQRDWEGLGRSYTALRAHAGRDTCETAVLARSLAEQGKPPPESADSAALCGQPSGCLFPVDSPPCKLARRVGAR